MNHGQIDIAAIVAACSLTACLQFLTLSPGAGEAVSGKRAGA